MLAEVFDDILDVIPQYKVLDYRINFCFPDLNLSVEYDEEHHQSEYNSLKDDERQSRIEQEIGCAFLRVNKGQELLALNQILKHGRNHA